MSNYCAIATDALRPALERVAKLATGRTTLPIINTVKISAVDNVMEIMATDLDIFAVAKCECDGKFEAVCVPATQFSMLVNSATDRIRLEVKDNRLIFDGGGNGVAKLAYFKADEFPAFPAGQAVKQGVETVALADAIAAVKWAALDGKERDFVLKNVLVKMEPMGLTTVAVDRAYGAKWSLPLICGAARFLVLADSCPLLCEALRETGAVLSLSDKHALVHSEALTIAVRLSEDTYPPYHLTFEMEKQELGKVNTEPFIASLFTAVNLSKDPLFCQTAIEFSPKGITIQLEASDHEYKGQIDGKYPTRSIRIDARRLIKCLKSINGEIATASASQRGLFFEHDNYVTCLGLLEDKKK